MFALQRGGLLIEIIVRVWGWGGGGSCLPLDGSARVCVKKRPPLLVSFSFVASVLHNWCVQDYWGRDVFTPDQTCPMSSEVLQ